MHAGHVWGLYILCMLCGRFCLRHLSKRWYLKSKNIPFWWLHHFILDPSASVTAQFLFLFSFSDDLDYFPFLLSEVQWVGFCFVSLEKVKRTKKKQINFIHDIFKRGDSAGQVFLCYFFKNNMQQYKNVFHLLWINKPKMWLFKMVSVLLTSYCKSTGSASLAHFALLFPYLFTAYLIVSQK